MSIHTAHVLYVPTYPYTYVYMVVGRFYIAPDTIASLQKCPEPADSIAWLTQLHLTPAPPGGIRPQRPGGIQLLQHILIKETFK